MIVVALKIQIRTEFHHERKQYPAVTHPVIAVCHGKWFGSRGGDGRELGNITKRTLKASFSPLKYAE